MLTDDVVVEEDVVVVERRVALDVVVELVGVTIVEQAGEDGQTTASFLFDDDDGEGCIRNGCVDFFAPPLLLGVPRCRRGCN